MTELLFSLLPETGWPCTHYVAEDGLELLTFCLDLSGAVSTGVGH